MSGLRSVSLSKNLCTANFRISKTYISSNTNFAANGKRPYRHQKNILKTKNITFWLAAFSLGVTLISPITAHAYWQFIQKQKWFSDSNSPLWSSPGEFCTHYAQYLSSAQASPWLVDHIENIQNPQSGNLAVCYVRDIYGYSHGYTLYGQCPNPPSPSGHFVYGLPNGCYINVESCPPAYSSLSTGECYPGLDYNEASGPQMCSPSVGNPIYPLTGSKRQREAIGQWGQITLATDFDSRSKISDAAFSAAPLPSFGSLWKSSLHKRLVLQSDSKGRVQAIQASRGKGDWISFNLNNNSSFAAHNGVADRVIATSDGWRYVDATAQTVEVYNTSGTLNTRQGVTGLAETYTYSTSSTPANLAPSAGLLLAVQDPVRIQGVATPAMPSGWRGGRGTSQKR